MKKINAKRESTLTRKILRKYFTRLQIEFVLSLEGKRAKQTYAWYCNVRFADDVKQSMLSFRKRYGMLPDFVYWSRTQTISDLWMSAKNVDLKSGGSIENARKKSDEKQASIAKTDRD